MNVSSYKQKFQIDPVTCSVLPLDRQLLTSQRVTFFFENPHTTVQNKKKVFIYLYIYFSDVNLLIYPFCYVRNGNQKSLIFLFS